MNFINTIYFMVTLICIAQYTVGQNYDAEINSYSDYSGENEGEDKTVEDSGFVTPLDFSPLFGGGAFGLSEAASNPAAEVFQKVPKKFQSLFDVGSSESQVVGLFQEQSAVDKEFSPESFGFLPQFSQGLAAETVNVPKRYQAKTVEIERTKATAKSSAITRAPHQFDVQTNHNTNYKKKPEDAAHRNYGDKGNPLSITSYQGVNPSEATRALKDDHLIPYKKYSFQKQEEYAPVPTYQALTSSYSGSYPYAQLASVDPKVLRYKRYSGNRRKSKSRKSKPAEEYDYQSDYKSRPKDFDESASYDSPDFSAYGDKDEDKKKYDYGGDSEYDNDEYERIKNLSEEQAAEVQKNPENCKKVAKNSMTCMVCQNPKTGGSYESCSYASEPKNNKYAYVKQQKFDSEDAPENKEESTNTDAKKIPSESEEIISTKAPIIQAKPKPTIQRPIRGGAKYQKTYIDQNTKASEPKIKSYFITQSGNPKAESTEPYATYQQEEADDYNDDEEGGESEEDEEDEQDDEEESGEESKENKKNQYDYNSSIPNFFTNNEEKKDVESVLAEFANKDRSACKKVHRNHMTCYQCTDKNGMKNEECMFVSESAPKSSHLAYKEVKEFNSKPQTANNDQGGVGAESKIVASYPTTADLLPIGSTNTPTIFIPKLNKNQPIKKFAGLDDISKKSTPATPRDHLPVDKISSYILSSTVPSKPVIVKRNARATPRKDEEFYVDSKMPAESSPLDQIADPSDFAGEESRGAFWAETVPKYDKVLGVSLPQFMLEKSEQEALFDKSLSAGI